MFQYMRREKGFYRRVAALSAPIVLQNLITSALAMADTFMVGMLGERPMAAVALANIPLFVVQLVLFGVQSGSSVLISQYWGRKDETAINRVIGVAAMIAAGVASICALILFLAPSQFLGLFGNDPEIVGIAVRYGRMAGLSYVFNALSLVYVAAFRSMAQPKLGLQMLGVSMCTNTFLNWVLIFGNLGAPALGVRGAAMATLISRILEFLLMAFHIAFNRTFRLKPGAILCPGREMALKFIRCGGPVICNETLWGLGTALLPTIMGHMAGSAEILAAHTIAGNVEKLCAVVRFGLAGSASILIGREIGAGRGDQVYGIGLVLNTLSIVCGVATGLLLGLIRITAPGWLFPLFHLSERSASIAGMMLTMLAFIMPLEDFNTVNVVGVLRGGGDVQAAALIDLIPLWLIALPEAAIAGLVLKLGIFWVYLFHPLEQIAKFIGGLWRLRSGKWIRDLTRSPAEV